MYKLFDLLYVYAVSFCPMFDAVTLSVYLSVLNHHVSHLKKYHPAHLAQIQNSSVEIKYDLCLESEEEDKSSDVE